MVWARPCGSLLRTGRQGSGWPFCREGDTWSVALFCNFTACFFCILEGSVSTFSGSCMHYFLPIWGGSFHFSPCDVVFSKGFLFCFSRKKIFLFFLINLLNFPLGISSDFPAFLFKKPFFFSPNPPISLLHYSVSGFGRDGGRPIVPWCQPLAH